MKGMLAMPKKKYIKYLREVKGESIASIAKQLEVNWRTAKKYGDCEDWNPQKLPKARVRTKMDNWMEIIETWLEEDQIRPRKQRHTAKRIFQRLVEEHGFTGSYRTVCYRVIRLKKQWNLKEKEAYLRLEHPGGEAQVDYGKIEAIIDGKQVKRSLLVLSYPYSNAAFVFVTRKENKVCFLEGLKQLFTMSGGVPRKIWFDNLSAAVVSLGKEGKRVITEEFERFALHYRFEAIFCNPGKGNEKGNVENKIGYSRRNWCVPLPAVKIEKELQEKLAQKAQQDLDRPHYQKKVHLRELWEEEKQKLLPLPAIPYDVHELQLVKTNGYGEISYQNRQIPLPSAGVHESYWLKIQWDQVEVLDLNYTLVHVISLVDSDKEPPVDIRAQLKPYIQKARALDYSSVTDYLPECIRNFLLTVRGESRRNRILWLRRMLKIYSIEELVRMFDEPMNQAFHSTELCQLEQILYRTRFPERKSVTILETCTPSVLRGKQPDLALYDQLQRMEVSK
jgi:transposase